MSATVFSRLSVGTVVIVISDREKMWQSHCHARHKSNRINALRPAEYFAHGGKLAKDTGGHSFKNVREAIESPKCQGLPLLAPTERPWRFGGDTS